MVRFWQKYVAVFGIVFFAIFVQCAAVCSAVVCETPKQEVSCPNHPEPEKHTQKICQDVTVVKADLQLDFSLLPDQLQSIVILPQVELCDNLIATVRDHAPPETFTILRI